MAVRAIYLSDDEMDKLGFRGLASVEDKFMLIRKCNFKHKSEMITKHIMTRAEAIALFKEYLAKDTGAERIVDFYIEAGMLEIKEEKENPIFEIISVEAVNSHIKIYANGQMEGVVGTVINRIPELIAKLKQNNS